MKKNKIQIVIIVVLAILLAVSILLFRISASSTQETELAGQILNYKDINDILSISIAKEFATVNKDGTFLISGIGEGVYTYTIWGKNGVYRAVKSENNVVIEGSQRNSLTIAIEKVE